MATLILYHSGCSDGYCAAWILKKVYPLAKLVPCNYGQHDDPPDVTDFDVVIADFSFHRSVMLDMSRRARSLLVLDHHRTAQEELHGLPFALFDMKRSGAGITWDHYFPEDPRPALVSYVEDRDIWARALPESDAVSAVIQSTPFEFDAWSELADRMDTDLSDVVHEGKAILKAHARIEERIEATKIDAVIDNYRVPTVNSSVLQSEVGNTLAVGVPFAASWNVDKDGNVKFSLRSAQDGADVAEIAKKFGGGGHAHASGFVVTLDQAMTMFTPRGLISS